MSQETIWFIFRADCYESMVMDMDFSKDQSCLLFTIAQLAGLVALACSLVQKIPQIQKILQNSSVEGLEPTSLYSELLMHIHSLSIYLHLKIPLSVYISNIFIALMCSFVVLLCWQFNKKISKTEKTIVSTVLVLYTATLIQDTNVPESFWKLI